MCICWYSPEEPNLEAKKICRKLVDNHCDSRCSRCFTTVGRSDSTAHTDTLHLCSMTFILTLPVSCYAMFKHNNMSYLVQPPFDPLQLLYASDRKSVITARWDKTQFIASDRPVSVRGLYSSKTRLCLTNVTRSL